MIKSLYFQHLLCFETFGATLSAGANVFTGGVECGLSSIKKAIYFTLTGQDALDLEPDFLVNNNIHKPICKSLVSLDRFGKQYFIERRIKPCELVLDDAHIDVSNIARYRDALDKRGLSLTILGVLINDSLFKMDPKQQWKFIKLFFAGAEAINLTEAEIDPQYLGDLDGLTVQNIAEYRGKFKKEIREYQTKADYARLAADKLNKIVVEEFNARDIENHQIEIMRINCMIKDEIPIKEDQNDILTERSQIDRLRNARYNPKYANYISKWKQDIESNQDQIEALQKYQGDSCPVHADIICTDRGQFNEIIQQHQEKIEFAKVKLDEMETLEASSRKGWQDDIDNQIKEHLGNLERLIQDYNAKTKITQEKNAVIREKNEAAKALLLEANRRLDDAKRMLEAAKEHEGKLRENESFVRYVKHYQTLITILDELGKSIKISHRHPSVFTQRINDIASQYDYVMSLDEAAGLLINKLPVSHCSMTARKICGVIVKNLIAEESGFTFYVEDDFQAIPLADQMRLLEWIDSNKSSAVILAHDVSESILTPGVKNKMKRI